MSKGDQLKRARQANRSRRQRPKNRRRIGGTPDDFARIAERDTPPLRSMSMDDRRATRERFAANEKRLMPKDTATTDQPSKPSLTAMPSAPLATPPSMSFLSPEILRALPSLRMGFPGLQPPTGAQAGGFVGGQWAPNQPGPGAGMMALRIR